MGLRERLDRLEGFSEQIQYAARQRAPGARERIFALRDEFNDECIATARAICDEPGISDNHEVFAAMQAALEVLRSRMIAHQLRWDADSIEQDRAGYFSAAQVVQDLLRDFVTNSRMFLRD